MSYTNQHTGQSTCFTVQHSSLTLTAAVNGAAIKGRPVAVDWVVPKVRYEASLQTQEEEKHNEEDENESQDHLGERDETMDTGEEREEEGGGGGDGDSASESECEDDESVSGEEGEEEGEEGGKKPFKADVHEGKTVFVR